MLYDRPRRVLLACVCVALFALAGCNTGGPQGVKVNGTIVPPSGMKLAKDDSVEIRFVPEQAGGAKGGATSASDPPTTFEMQGVEPGKYKVTLRFQPYPGEKDAERREALFESINDAYTPEATKLTYEVTKDPVQSITIDLAKKTVVKQ